MRLHSGRQLHVSTLLVSLQLYYAPVAAATPGSGPPCLLVAGLSARERSLIANVAREVSGIEWQLREVPYKKRMAVLQGLAGHELEGWITESVIEALEADGTTGEITDPVLVTASHANYGHSVDDVTMITMLDEAVDLHIRNHGLKRPVETHETPWHAGLASVVVNAELDGLYVSDGIGDVSECVDRSTGAEQGASQRWDTSALVAFDSVVDDELRAALLKLLVGNRGWDPEEGPDIEKWERGTFSDTAMQSGRKRGAGWGLRKRALIELCGEPPRRQTPRAIVELQSRLCKLIADANAGKGEVIVCRMPPVYGDDVLPLAANAPVAEDGDMYSWHIDADPYALPSSSWTDCFGRYLNRCPGRPRFVSALVYLSPKWHEDWGGPTRFLDPPSGEVLSIYPKPGRLVLMDQDISHSVTAPRKAAGRRPRYSLVLKLVLHGAVIRLADPSWGEPEMIGSARGQLRGSKRQ